VLASLGKIDLLGHHRQHEPRVTRRLDEQTCGAWQKPWCRAATGQRPCLARPPPIQPPATDDPPLQRPNSGEIRRGPRPNGFSRCAADCRRRATARLSRCGRSSVGHWGGGSPRFADAYLLDPQHCRPSPWCSRPLGQGRVPTASSAHHGLAERRVRSVGPMKIVRAQAALTFQVITYYAQTGRPSPSALAQALAEQCVQRLDQTRSCPISWPTRPTTAADQDQPAGRSVSLTSAWQVASESSEQAPSSAAGQLPGFLDAPTEPAEPGLVLQSRTRPLPARVFRGSIDESRDIRSSSPPCKNWLPRLLGMPRLRKSPAQLGRRAGCAGWARRRCLPPLLWGRPRRLFASRVHRGHAELSGPGVCSPKAWGAAGRVVVPIGARLPTQSELFAAPTSVVNVMHSLQLGSDQKQCTRTALGAGTVVRPAPRRHPLGMIWRNLARQTPRTAT